VHELAVVVVKEDLFATVIKGWVLPTWMPYSGSILTRLFTHLVLLSLLM
jgi:hypothetical protein